MRFFLGLIGLLWISPSLSAQEGETILDRFTATDASGIVYVDWTISAGYTCFGIDILRSTDSIHFEEVGHVGGICGSLENPVNYRYEDHQPVPNTTNYYRLHMGSYGLSHIISVSLVNIDVEGFLIRPNPASDRLRIHFENATHEAYLLEIFNLQGTLQFTSSSSDRFFELNVGEWMTGVYFFGLTNLNDHESRFGKIVVKH